MLKCLDAAGQACQQCVQVCAQRTRNEHRQRGSLPNCKAHGPHANMGHAAVIAALQAVGVTTPIQQEGGRHSHGAWSRRKGRICKHKAFRCDLRVAVAAKDGSTREVVVEVDGMEHARPDRQKNDEKRDKMVGIPTLRISGDGEVDLEALSQFVWGTEQGAG